MSNSLKLTEKLNVKSNKVDSNKSTKERVEDTVTEELVIGICSPIGSLKEEVINSLETILHDKYGYIIKRIKISHFIEKYTSPKDKNEDFKGSQGYLDKMGKIIQGDKLREKYGHGVLAELAVSQMNFEREESLKSEEQIDIDPREISGRRICYIIDSLKNKEELDILRSIYREIFYLFSVFSPKEERQENLTKKQLEIHKEVTATEAEKLINADEHEVFDHGQHVRDVFVEADFFVRVSNETRETIEQRIVRFVSLIFNSKVITPSQDETAMYAAKSAATNSACLSRQVGASITDESGVILSTGWNDVPKFGGNLYNQNSLIDNRCFEKGYCFNDKTKAELSENIISKILEVEMLNVNITKELKQKILNKIKSSKIRDLIEFSRSVHAEMHAIISGSQISGTKMINGKLYCTTYPCHNCARHIIVSGITTVYFIEPYVKSLCLELHGDDITDKEKSTEQKVKILVFEGVAPRRYLDFFTMTDSRKEKITGKLINNVNNLKNLKPKTSITLQALATLEKHAMIPIKDLINKSL